MLSPRKGAIGGSIPPPGSIYRSLTVRRYPGAMTQTHEQMIERRVERDRRILAERYAVERRQRARRAVEAIMSRTPVDLDA